MFVQGHVTDLNGKPLANVPVDIWHADDDGWYDSQKPDYETAGPSSRGRFITDAEGKFYFRTILPCSYPIPTDGPVGQMILGLHRHPMRPAHVHFMVSADGYQTLITHVFAAGDPYLDEDAVFGVKEALIAQFESHPGSEVAPDGTTPGQPYSTMDYELRLASEPGAGEEG